jgi:hypothetical protein
MVAALDDQNTSFYVKLAEIMQLSEARLRSDISRQTKMPRCSGGIRPIGTNLTLFHTKMRDLYRLPKTCVWVRLK